MEMTDATGNDGTTSCCALGVNCIRLSYDEYGNSAVSTTAVAYRYTGRYFDIETGLYYYRARYYDPPLGRFMQMDPIGYQSDVNAYTYVYNDPFDRTDPSGNAVGIDDAVGFAVGGLINLSIQGWRDIISVSLGGDGGTAGESVGAFISGGVAGVAAVNLPETGGASALIVTSGLASAAGNVTEQAVDKGIENIDPGEVAVHGALGAAFGGILQKVLPGARIPGLSSGGNSANAIAKAAKTKIASGVVKSMSTKTAAKAAAGEKAENAVRNVVADKAEDTATKKQPPSDTHGDEKFFFCNKNWDGCPQ